MGERWQERFRAGRVGLPSWAREAPDHSLFRSDVSGTWELYAWDRASGERRQVTKRHHGTETGAIDPTGAWVWWFDDSGGDEFGVWRRRPFTGGPDERAFPGLEPSFMGGLALGAGGSAVVGRSTDHGFSAHAGWAGGAAETVYAHREEGWVCGLSRDGSLIALAHSEHGDSRHMAVRVLRAPGTAPGAGDTVADLWDGPGRDLTPVGFAPAGTCLLVLHERHGRREPLLWDPLTGDEREIRLGLAGEVWADWTPAGALLVTEEARGRTALYRYDLGTESLTRLDVPEGVVSAAAERPDGTVEYAWSSAAHPPVVRDTSGSVVLRADGPQAPPSVPAEDAFVEGPGGTVHALVSRPATGTAPYPTVFCLHGGPQVQDRDSFDPAVAAWVDHGFAVVRVNYRGSTGYGAAWRDALEGRVGLTELEDVTAVRDWAVTTGLADPDRLVVEGGSWGGYLALLALGRHPHDWSAGIAAVPIADYATAYADEMEALRSFDRALFGGAPDQVPDRYRRSSPITYAAALRAPVLVLAGENDPRCPIRQVDTYLDRLAALGKEHEVYRFDAGHGSFVVDERIRQMAAELDFALRVTAGEGAAAGAS
ncbi:alpha/beta fold hydrolase [Streptomonospora nanhaiensis]|uniref:S9 family peptidase n=1 Tax=Streptomonospora nanhaiensis TaxID=1323731 RepID=UPI001C381BE1|nr:alpha/beta fold hydrolase [Streptomonospora nanhaiensis]MBV2364028.1 prolyl oligopeptidase family serine peptidase [Streptomonospora nanhaiensis]MBX9387372.1 prolyl oligopeptidase family serine peptidase [Streptomonospora nanhaiensis]